jgi:hypothetical protein
MTLQKLLRDENTNVENVQNYFKTLGLGYVNRKDLDKIIDRSG